MGHTGHMMTHFGESRESRELVIMWYTCINVNDCQKRETLDLWQWTYFVYFYLCFDWRKFLNFLDWNKEQSATLEHDQNKNVLFRFKDLRGLEGNDRIVTNSRNNPKYRWKRWCRIKSLKFLAERGSDSCRGAHCRLRIWSDILINLEKYSTYLIIYRLTARCKVFLPKMSSWKLNENFKIKGHFRAI